MINSFWTDWYSGWGWLLWFGIMMLLFMNIGNWGYTYRVHRTYGQPARPEAFDILSERYAKGEITREEYVQMKSTIAAAVVAQ